jgi:predicted nucleic acid-binding protein
VGDAPVAGEAAMLVVDASLVAKWLFPEADSPAARRLYAGWVKGRLDLVAPDLLVPELGALCHQKRLRREIGEGDAVEAHRLLLETLPRLVPSWQLADGALVLALRHDRPVAETVHLALALREGCPFVTADERVLRALGPVFPCVRHLDDVAAEL